MVTMLTWQHRHNLVLLQPLHANGTILIRLLYLKSFDHFELLFRNTSQNSKPIFFLINLNLPVSPMPNNKLLIKIIIKPTLFIHIVQKFLILKHQIARSNYPLLSLVSQIIIHYLMTKNKS